eukprot:SAG11_NODE_1526_length_4741_cov_1.622576_1_plen_210_part_00
METFEQRHKQRRRRSGQPRGAEERRALHVGEQEWRAGLRQYDKTAAAAAARRSSSSLLLDDDGGEGSLALANARGAAAAAEMLAKRVARLEAALRRAQGADVEGWDGTLRAAEKALRAAARRVLSGDPSAEAAFNGWSSIITAHPEHRARERRSAAAWEEAVFTRCQRALYELRPLVPHNIVRLKREEVLAHRPLIGRTALANRIWSTR